MPYEQTQMRHEYGNLKWKVPAERSYSIGFMNPKETETYYARADERLSIRDCQVVISSVRLAYYII